MEKDEHLIQEMVQAGLVATPTSQLFITIKHELTEYARKHPLYDGGSKKGAAAAAGGGVAGEEAHGEEDSSSTTSDSSTMDSVEDIQELLSRPIFHENGLLVHKPPLNTKHKPEEWNKLVSQYFKTPTNTLEKDRDAYYQERMNQKSIHIDDCRSEADLLMLQRQRYCVRVYL